MDSDMIIYSAPNEIRTLLTSLPSCCADFYASLKGEKKGETLRAYLSDINTLYTYLEKKDLVTVTPEDIASYLSHEKEEGFSSSTITRKTYSLRKFFQFLYRSGAMSYDPMNGIRSDRFIRKSSGTFKPDDIQRLFDGILANDRMLVSEYRDGKKKHAAVAIDENTRLKREVTLSRNYLMVILNATLGIRPSELAAIDLEDLDLKTETLLAGKGTKQARTIDLSEFPEVLSAASSYLDTKDPLTWFTDRYGSAGYEILSYIKEHLLLVSLSDKDISEISGRLLAIGEQMEFTKELKNDIIIAAALQRTRGRMAIGPAVGESALFITMNGGRLSKKNGRGCRMSASSIKYTISSLIRTYVPDCAAMNLSSPSKLRRSVIRNMLETNTEEFVSGVSGAARNTVYQIRKD